MTSKKKALIVAAMVIIIVLVFGACEKEPFRLHILANSNSEQDQQIKLDVRDAVLQVTHDEIEQCKNAVETEEYIRDNIGIILETANDMLAKNGVSYQATATVGNYHFPDKSYRDVRYPEGDYQALRILLGDGEGENWWCVMFPPLCITEIEEEDEQDIEYTSFLAELFITLFGK